MNVKPFEMYEQRLIRDGIARLVHRLAWALAAYALSSSWALADTYSDLTDSDKNYVKQYCIYPANLQNQWPGE